MTEEHCVSCGEIIPEGTEVCPQCRKKAEMAFDHISNNVETYERFNPIATVIGFIVILAMIIGAYSFGYHLGSRHIAEVEMIPETTVIQETTTIPETTAPETTVPETTIPETTIPETTIPATEATVPISETEGIYVIPETTISTEPVTNVNQDDVELLACVIYQEAGADYCCDTCRRRVADIVLNRVNSERFPDTIYEVLTQQNQYGMFWKTGVVWPGRAKYEQEAHAVERAYRIAEEVLAGKHSDVYGNGYIWQAGFKQGTQGFWCCGHFYGR